MPDKPAIVFAHGLWADGSCYSKVIPLLSADGFQVISTQNHLNTVADDAAAVRTSFARATRRGRQHTARTHRRRRAEPAIGHEVDQAGGIDAERPKGGLLLRERERTLGVCWRLA